MSDMILLSEHGARAAGLDLIISFGLLFLGGHKLSVCIVALFLDPVDSRAVELRDARRQLLRLDLGGVIGECREFVLYAESFIQRVLTGMADGVEGCGVFARRHVFGGALGLDVADELQGGPMHPFDRLAARRPLLDEDSQRVIGLAAHGAAGA